MPNEGEMPAVAVPVTECYQCPCHGPAAHEALGFWCMARECLVASDSLFGGKPDDCNVVEIIIVRKVHHGGTENTEEEK